MANRVLYVDRLENNRKGEFKIFLTCCACNQVFERKNGGIKKGTIRIYCSPKCRGAGQTTLGKTTVKCTQCGKGVYKRNSTITKNNFCNHSCATKYAMAHKTGGYNRSKLEFWLEDKLSILYPGLKIIYNDSSMFKMELDIYIPSLKLAFELNGIFHYEPIFGPEKLLKTQTNDKRKFQACLENNIELCIIDTTNQKYFKEKTSQQFLDIIIKIINLKLNPDNNA